MKIQGTSNQVNSKKKLRCNQMHSINQKSNHKECVSSLYMNSCERDFNDIEDAVFHIHTKKHVTTNPLQCERALILH